MVFCEGVIEVSVKIKCGGCCSIKKDDKFIWKCDQTECPMFHYLFAQTDKILDTCLT